MQRKEGKEVYKECKYLQKEEKIRRAITSIDEQKISSEPSSPLLKTIESNLFSYNYIVYMSKPTLFVYDYRHLSQKSKLRICIYTGRKRK
jgi:hypothetical protein